VSGSPVTVERTLRGAWGGRLLVRETGPADGPPIVVLHGLCGTGDSVLSSAMLARAGHRVIDYDARGHGRSERARGPGDYRYRDLCADLLAVLDAYADRPPLLVGASMGGVTAARLLLEERPRRPTGLVLITPAFDPRHRLTPDERRRSRQFVAALRTGDTEAFDAADPLPGDHPGITAMIRKLLRRRLDDHADLGAVADAVEGLVEDVAFASLEQLGAIRVPAVVVASHDRWDGLHPYATAEAWAHALPRGRLVAEAPDHVPLAWRPRRVAELVAEFARELATGRESSA
jgi:pimeloyl-ACP methyl ester carboxylesterase